MSDTGWTPAWPVTGNARHTRVMASALGAPAGSCREKLASKARPALFLDRPFDRAMNGRTAPYRTFSLGIVVDAVRLLASNPEVVPADADPVVAAASLVDAVLSDGASAHAGARTWAVHAVTSYLEADEYLREDFPGLRPVGTRAVMYKSPDGEVKEVDVWGLWLRDQSTGVAELRMLRQRAIGDARPRDPAVVAVGAKIAADGQPYETDGKRYRPFLPMVDTDGEVRRVRVVDVGLADASYDVLFDGTVEEARELYAHVAAPQVATVLSGGGFSPGRDCDGCYVIEGCPAVPRRGGLLGVVGLATHRRYLTHTRLRDYEICPARYWLTAEAGVPQQRFESLGAARRGILVHAALEWLHARDVAVPCAAADLGDENDLPPVAIAIGALAEEWREVVRYLRHHVDVCALKLSLDWLRSEPSIVAFDNEADVVVSARPDLVAGAGDVVMWRETKTAAIAPPDDDLLLLEQYPQAALGLVLVAAGVVAEGSDALTVHDATGDGTEVVPGIVELEILTPTSARVVRYSTTDAATLQSARILLASRVDPWLRDTAFNPEPGPQCSWCPVQEWCRPELSSNAARAAVAMVVDGYRVDPETGEILPVGGDTTRSGGHAVIDVSADARAGVEAAGTPGVGSAGPSARVRSLAESIVGVSGETSDDDVPF